MFDDEETCQTCEEGVYVINAERTFRALAKNLRAGRNLFFAWTDKERKTQCDIFLGIETYSHGPIQGGLKGGGHLMVGIVRVGFFGFRLDSELKIYADYVTEKLFVRGPEAEEIALLISEVRRLYQEMKV